jgi:hypothetical protein
MRTRYLGLAASLFALNGCGITYFSHRDTNPVVWDEVAGYAALSTDAQRRTIFVRKTEVPFVCAEPPPDVAQSYASAVTAALKGSGGPAATPVTVDLGGGREVATAALPLMYRSQGLQYKRDSMMSLCLAIMNGTVSPSDWIPEVQRIDTNTMTLIQAEMKALEAAAPVDRKPVQAQLGSSGPVQGQSGSPKPAQN